MCQWIADRTAAPLQKGNIDSISVPLILNRYFIFLMALMRVIKKSEVSKLYSIHVCCPLYFLFCPSCCKKGQNNVQRVNFEEIRQLLCPVTVLAELKAFPTLNVCFPISSNLLRTSGPFSMSIKFSQWLRGKLLASPVRTNLHSEKKIADFSNFEKKSRLLGGLLTSPALPWLLQFDK